MAGRLAVSLAIACALAGVAVEPPTADAARKASSGRQKAKERTLRRKTNGMPKFLGEGAFSQAFRTRDGKHVIKRLKPKLVGQPLTREERGGMASRYVASIQVLRRAGLPVTNARVPDRHPHMIVQPFARRGVSFRELRIRAKFRALASAIAISARAWYHLKRAGARGVFVDPLVQNMRFDRAGRVVEWFDPVGPVSLPRWIGLQIRSLFSAKPAPARRGARPAR